MKFRVERDGLAEAVGFVARSLPARAPVPVLGGVLLDGASSTETLSLSAFDYEVSARVELAAMIGESGRGLVSGRLLADIARSLPPHPVDVVLDGARLAITCGSTKFSLPTMPVEDYPQLPELPPVAGALAPDTFATAVAQVAVAAGRDDTLPMLTGIRVEITESTLTMAATDRFRLAVREFGWEPTGGVEPTAVLVPARTLADAAKTFGPGGGPLQLALAAGEGLLGLAGGGRRCTTRLLDAEFPPYRKLLPTEHTSVAVLDVPPLVEAVKRVSLVAERGTQVRLEFTDGSLRCSAGGEDEGSAEEELACEFDGEPLTIAFNPGYLLDGLGVLHSERVHLSFTTPSRPALLRPAPARGAEDSEPAQDRPADDRPVAAGAAAEVAGAAGAGAGPASGYIYLLMPVRLPG